MTQTIALLGLGNMGAGMAGQLLKLGFPLNVWYRNRDRAAPFVQQGALAAESPRRAAAGAELLFLVGGDAAVLDRVRPVLRAMSRDVAHLGPTGSGALMKLIPA